MKTTETILVVAAIGAFGYILYSMYAADKTVIQQLASDLTKSSDSQ